MYIYGTLLNFHIKKKTICLTNSENFDFLAFLGKKKLHDQFLICKSRKIAFSIKIS